MKKKWGAGREEGGRGMRVEVQERETRMEQRKGKTGGSGKEGSVRRGRKRKFVGFYGQTEKD